MINIRSPLCVVGLSLLFGVTLMLGSGCKKAINRGYTAPPKQTTPDTSGRAGMNEPPSRWTGPIDEPLRRDIHFDLSPAVVQFRDLIKRKGDIRICIYYNSSLSPQISSWQVDSRGVLELCVKQTGNVNMGELSSPPSSIYAGRDVSIHDNTSESGVGQGELQFTVFTENRIPDEIESQSIETILSDRIESSIIDAIVSGGAKVVDKTLAFRMIALDSNLVELRDAEIRTLKDRVDMLMELSLIPNPLTMEGYEVRLKAIRTHDASILTFKTTASIDKLLSEEFQYIPQPGGFVKERREIYATLEYLCERLAAETMMAIAQNW